MAGDTKWTLEGLKELLLSNKVPLEMWGIGGAKSAEDFLRELTKGESEVVTTGGAIARRTRVTRLDIRDFSDRRLVEVRQILPDGRSRERKLEVTASEKLYPGENPGSGLERLLKEEFPFLQAYRCRCQDWEFLEERKSSQSYPGLPTIYEFFTFTLVLSSAETPPLFGDPKAGLKQGDGMAFYEWQEV